MIGCCRAPRCCHQGRFPLDHEVLPADKRNYFIARGVLGAVGMLISLVFKDQFLGVAVIDYSLIIASGCMDYTCTQSEITPRVSNPLTNNLN